MEVVAGISGARRVLRQAGSRTACRNRKEHVGLFEEMVVDKTDAVQSDRYVHKTAFPDPSPKPRGRGGDKVREKWGAISASLGAMRPLVEKLDKLLLDPPQRCSSNKVKVEMYLLKKDVEELSAYLDELSEVEDPPPTAKCWMNETRDLSYKMEDHIDSLLFPSRKWFSHAKALKGKKQIVATVSEFRKYAKEAIRGRELYVPSDSNTLRRRFVSLGPMLPTPYEDIVIDGRMNEFINSFAKNGDKQLNVVSVLGSACLGKTTLARVLYNKLGKRYHCRAFIRVSRKPDTKRIFRDMLSQLQGQDPPEYRNELDLINNIKNYLQNKRYLIIIDDVWAASVWNIINHALPDGSHGSRIITTTQIADVALTCCCYQSKLVFEMKPLDDYHSRKLFFNRLFGSESYCPEQFKEVLNKIVEICGGLPLATISIAGLLGSQPVMTEDLLKHIHESLRFCFSASSTSERTRQALNLSFKNLPHYLKTCLLYLSMYPQGYTFCTSQLVKQWMAEGFIDTTKVQDMEKVAESYLHQLIGRSFIQPIHVNYNNEVFLCALHDTVHDLIALKSAEDNFIVAIDYSPTNVYLSHKARRLSLLFGDARYAKIPANIGKSQQRSLIYVGSFECMPCITEYKRLRVLDLQVSDHGGKGNPVDLTGISELIQLRYLKIGCGLCIKLPTGGLKCLETLDITDAIGIKSIWSFKLPHLLHLNVPFEQSLTYLEGRSMWIPRKGPWLNSLEDLYMAVSSTHSYDPDGLDTHLSFLIKGHGNLRTLVLSQGSTVKKGGITPDMQRSVSKRLGLPSHLKWRVVHTLECSPLLQRFECSPASGIQFFRIPKWFKDLENLSILKITVRILEMDCIGTLRELRALTALSLYVHRQSTERIIFDKAEFSALKYFKLRYMSGIAWIKFEADAMPNLLKLRLVFNSVPRMDLQPFFISNYYGQHEQYKRGNALIIIEHMPSLEEISAKVGGAAVGVHYVLKTFNIDERNPRINMQLVDHSSYGDESTKQKQQPEEILEEEPSGSNKQQVEEILEEEPSESNKQQEEEILEKEPDNYDKIFEKSRSSRLEKKKKMFPRVHFSEMALKKVLRYVRWGRKKTSHPRKDGAKFLEAESADLIDIYPLGNSM